MKKIYLMAFSLVELMVTLVVVSILTAAMAPVITKKLKSKEITVSSGTSKDIEFEQDCTAFGVDCALCFDDRCALCAKVCNSDEYVDTPECVCKPCNIYEQCLECTAKQCTKCNLGYYLENRQCTICPIANSCDGTYKTACADGYYSDVEGLGTCKTCASKIENCATCNKETGACETCKDGYDLKEEVCKSKEFKYTYTGTALKTTTEDYIRIVLTTNGTFTAQNDRTGNVLVVAGGGGGGASHYYCGGDGGCGCAGNVVQSEFDFISGTSWSVTIGSGGNGGSANCWGAGGAGKAGTNSSFDSLTATGGGGGPGGAAGGTCTGGSAITFAGAEYATGCNAGANTGTGGTGGSGCANTHQGGENYSMCGRAGSVGNSGAVVIMIPM